MMKAALERGSRTFTICVYEPTNAKSTLAGILEEDKDKGELSRKYKGDGYYRMTILPTKRNLDKEFKGKTVMDVERRIRAEYTDDYINRATKIVENPPVFSGSGVNQVVFCDDVLALIHKSTGLDRNNWSRPDMPEGRRELVVVADGKEYKLLREEGYQEFADYPYRSEYNYANGCYFWVPESGSLYCTDVYEAVPDDVKYFDIVEFNPDTNQKRYMSRGVNISGDKHLFDIVAAGMSSGKSGICVLKIL